MVRSVRLVRRLRATAWIRDGSTAPASAIGSARRSAWGSTRFTTSDGLRTRAGASTTACASARRSVMGYLNEKIPVSASGFRLRAPGSWVGAFSAAPERTCACAANKLSRRPAGRADDHRLWRDGAVGKVHRRAGRHLYV